MCELLFATSGDPMAGSFVVDTGEPLDQNSSSIHRTPDAGGSGNRWCASVTVWPLPRAISPSASRTRQPSAQRSFLQTLIDNIPVAVSAQHEAAERGRIVLWNECYSVMFGVPVGRCWRNCCRRAIGRKCCAHRRAGPATAGKSHGAGDE
jgi:hypothetical protein